MIENSIAAKFVKTLKESEYVKLSRAEALYEGLDPQHPGAHWEIGGRYEYWLDQFRKGGSAAVGQAFSQLNFEDDPQWDTTTLLAKHCFSTADWEYLSDLGRSLLAAQSSADPTDCASSQVIGEFITNTIENNLEGETSDDPEWQAEAQQYRLQAEFQFDSADSTYNWAKRLKLWKMDYDENSTAIALCRTALAQIDLSEVGRQIAIQLRLPQAIEREKATGLIGASVTPWEESESGKDYHAWEYFQRLVDWTWVGLYVKHMLVHPNTPVPASVEDAPTRIAMETVAAIAKQNRDELALDFEQYDAGHIAKLRIQKQMQNYPAIRDLMESPEGLFLQETIDSNKVFQSRIRLQIHDQLNSRWGVNPQSIALELGGIDLCSPTWKQQTADRLTQSFDITREQLRKLNLIP